MSVGTLAQGRRMSVKTPFLTTHQGHRMSTMYITNTSLLLLLLCLVLLVRVALQVDDDY